MGNVPVSSVSLRDQFTDKIWLNPLCLVADNLPGHTCIATWCQSFYHIIRPQATDILGAEFLRLISLAAVDQTK